MSGAHGCRHIRKLPSSTGCTAAAMALGAPVHVWPLCAFFPQLGRGTPLHSAAASRKPCTLFCNSSGACLRLPTIAASSLCPVSVFFCRLLATATEATNCLYRYLPLLCSAAGPRRACRPPARQGGSLAGRRPAAVPPAGPAAGRAPRPPHAAAAGLGAGAVAGGARRRAARAAGGAAADVAARRRARCADVAHAAVGARGGAAARQVGPFKSAWLCCALAPPHPVCMFPPTAAASSARGSSSCVPQRFLQGGPAWQRARQLSSCQLSG